MVLHTSLANVNKRGIKSLPLARGVAYTTLGGKVLGNSVTPTLKEVGSTSDKQTISEKVTPYKECSWSSLIVGHAKLGNFRRALILYNEAQGACSHINEYAFAALLKACAELMDFQKGYEIHTQVISIGLLECDIFVGNALVDMYVKVGFLAEAQLVFNSLPVHDVVSWNVLITGYVRQDCGEEALDLFALMQLEGTSPNLVTFISSLKACTIAGAVQKCRELHAEVARAGLMQRDISVGNVLVDAYVNCGVITRAREVFEYLRVRDVISWNTLMSGYAKYAYAREALHCFEQMQLEGIVPDAVTLVCGLKASGMVDATDEGRKIHMWVASTGLLERDLVVGNALVDMYATHGPFEKAEQVFGHLPVRNVVSWTALIAGYAEHDRNTEALLHFEQMQTEGVFPNVVTLVCILKACGSAGDINKGQELHAKIYMLGFSETNATVCNSLLNMYARCGMLEKAQKVFDALPHQDTAAWNALITGYVQNARAAEALDCLKRMQRVGVPLDAVTFVCGLKAFGDIGATGEGSNLEDEIFRKGLLGDVIVANALVDFYIKSGALLKARDLFNKLPVRDVVSWTTIMRSYIRQGQGAEALNCLQQMQDKGIAPDAVTLVHCLKSCGLIGATEKGNELHAHVAETGVLNSNLVVSSALVDMYAKSGRIAQAQVEFDNLPVRDVVLWTSLLAGYADNESSVEALVIFSRMEAEGVSPDSITYMCVLKACGVIGAIGKGIEMYAEIAGKGLLEEDHGHPNLRNALVSMYANWGFLPDAEELIDKLLHFNVSSWNALILGYAQHGEVDNAFNTFNRMKAESEVPSIVSLMGIRNAFNSLGLANRGIMSVGPILNEHGISPLCLEHYVCMMHLLNCTGGYFDRAGTLIRVMPFHVDLGKMAYGH